jgi:hypothetical protein
VGKERGKISITLKKKFGSWSDNKIDDIFSLSKMVIFDHFIIFKKLARHNRKQNERNEVAID